MINIHFLQDSSHLQPISHTCLISFKKKAIKSVLSFLILVCCILLITDLSTKKQVLERELKCAMFPNTIHHKKKIKNEIIGHEIHHITHGCSLLDHLINRPKKHKPYAHTLTKWYLVMVKGNNLPTMMLWAQTPTSISLELGIPYPFSHTLKMF